MSPAASGSHATSGSQRSAQASFAVGSSSRFAAIANKAVSWGALNPAASSRRRIAWPIPSASHKARATSTTPSSNTRSISISGSPRAASRSGSSAPSTRLMLFTRRFSASRSSLSARPKLWPTRASARLVAAFQTFSARP